MRTQREGQSSSARQRAGRRVNTDLIQRDREGPWMMRCSPKGEWTLEYGSEGEGKERALPGVGEIPAFGERARVCFRE